MKKITACLMAALLLAGCFLTAASAAEPAACSCDRAPIVHICGLGNPVADETGTVFPPQGKTVAATVFTALPLLPGLLGGSLNAREQARALAAAEKIFSPIAFDKNGDPATPAAATFTYPAEVPHGHGEIVSFDYDWRLDPFVIADQLRDFIAYVEQKTGHDSVYLVGESMGTAIMDTYLSVYGFDDVLGVVWYNGAYRGVATCSESFANRNSFSADTFAAYLRQVGAFTGNRTLTDLFAALADSGLLESALDSVSRISDQLASNGTLTRFSYTQIGRIPGFWALVSAEDYEAARDFIFPTPALREEYAGLLARLDRYYNEVSSKTDEIMAAAEAATGKVGVVCGYGETIVAVTSDNTRQSDSVILTEDASSGAISAPVGETLGPNYTQAVADGHDHLSPDGVIDASAAFFPDHTWFIKYGHHSAAFNGYAGELLREIFYTEDFNVFTDARWPQFLLRDPVTDTVRPLAEDPAAAVTAEPGFGARLLTALFRAVNAFVRILKAVVPAVGSGC